MKKQILYATTFAASFIFLTNCGPKMEEKQRDPVSIPNGKKFEDTTLVNFADEDFASDNLIKRATVQDALSQIEMMAEISKISENSDWKKKTSQAYQDLEKKLATKKLSYSNSVYLNLVYSQIHSDVNANVKQADKKIATDTQKVIDLISKSQKSSLQIAPDSSLHDKLMAAQKYLDFLNSEVKKMNIMPEFKDEFLTELKKQSQTLLADATDFDENLVRSDKLENSLKIITAFLQKTSTQLSSEDQNNLNLGLQLSASLNSMTDAQTGLQSLAIVWMLLNDQQRIDYFKTASQDLYDFLSKKSAEDIQCMSEKSCRGFKTKIVLNLGVYPAIEKFGLKNISDLINQKSLHFINEKVNQVAFDILNQIGETIADQVISSVSQKRSDLGQFKDNLRGNLSKGLEQEFGSLKIKTPSILILDSQNSLLDFDSQSTYIRNKIAYLSDATEKSKRMQLQFEVIEGFLNLPLFSQSVETNEKALQSDLTDILLKPEARQFVNSRSDSKSEVNLKQQSELLNTAASALELFSDWKPSSLDGELSAIQANEILTQFKSKDLERSFFPKKDLTALTLSVASQVLQLMHSESSMLVLVDNENQILPVQKISDKSLGPIALAAATDFKKGIRIPTAKASDLGDFLNSMVRFYKATEGVENTQSELLTREDDTGSSLLAQIVSARKDVKLLIVAVSNFISNQLIQPNGLVSKSIALNENLKPLEKYELLDQTRSIDALIKAYEMTKIDVYLWTAKNIYRSMNRLLYSDKMKFYQQSTENEVQSGIDRTKLLETYKNLLLLKPYLSPEQQTQLENIFAAWLKA